MTTDRGQGEHVRSWFPQPPGEPLYACVFVPEFPAQALLRLRPELTGKPVAVLHGAAPHERVCAANAAARRQGLTNGMTRVEAESFGGMTLLNRSTREEEQGRQILLGAVSNYTPMAETRHTDTEAICVLDVAGMARLYTEPKLFTRALCAALKSRGLHASLAISRNFHAACAVARGKQGTTVIAPGEEQSMLSPLLLHVVGVEPEQSATLQLWGIRTLGGLAALPQKELIARMGQPGKQLRELARGEHPHLFAPEPVRWELHEEFQFDAPVTLFDGILFVLSTMIDQLVSQARERILAIATVTVLFHLERNVSDPQASNKVKALLEGSKEATHQRVIRPTLPTGDKRVLLRLLQLDLAAHPPGAPVLGVVVEATAARTGAVQNGLFAPPLPEPSRLDVTVARLTALVGEGRVGSPVLRDTYCPDSFNVDLFQNQPAESSAAVRRAPAMRLLRPAEPATVYTRGSEPDRFSFRGELYQVRSASGPWRMNGEWWSPGAWSYECWDVEGERVSEQTPQPAWPHKASLSIRTPFLLQTTATPRIRLCCRLRRTLSAQPTDNDWCMEGLYD